MTRKFLAKIFTTIGLIVGSIAFIIVQEGFFLETTKNP